MPERYLSDVPLHVQPELVGRPLASPLRRAAAFAVDVAVLIVPTVAAALALALVLLYSTDPAAFSALRRLWSGSPESPAGVQHVLRDVLPLLVRLEAKGLPARVVALVEEGRIDEAAARLADFDFVIRLSATESDGPLAPKTVYVQVERLIPAPVRGMALFVVPAVYFALFTSGRRGATAGKRLTGIRVVRLDGHRLSALEGLERFVGYLEIPGTFFTGLVDLWRDPNRRMAHDRVVNTAVVRVQRTAATEPQAADDEELEVKTSEPDAARSL